MKTLRVHDLWFLLSKVMEQLATFVWVEKCEKAFVVLKRLLVAEPILDEKLKLVDAISRKLATTEQIYRSTKLKQLAVVWSMERFQHYLLFGMKFTVFFDCNAVLALESQSGST